MPMTTIDPNLGTGKFLAAEYDPNKSAEHESLAANQPALKDGTAMAKLTGGANIGKVVPFNPAGIDGAAVLYGYLFGAKKAKTTVQRVVVVVRDIIVNGNLVTYHFATTDNEKAAAEASVKAVGLIVRK